VLKKRLKILENFAKKIVKKQTCLHVFAAALLLQQMITSKMYHECCPIATINIKENLLVNFSLNFSVQQITIIPTFHFAL